MWLLVWEWLQLILKYMSSDTIICSNLIPIDPRTNTYTLEVIKVTGSGLNKE